MNSTSLIGRLTRDPESRLAGGTTVCKLRLAVDRGGRDGTDFFDIAVFGAQANACATHLAKGRQVGVSGELRYSEWNAQDGSKRSRVEVVARHVQFLGGRNSSDAPAPHDDAEPVPDYAPDDIPF